MFKEELQLDQDHQQCASVETSGILERKKLSMSVAIVAADAPNNSQQMAPASCYH